MFNTCNEVLIGGKIFSLGCLLKEMGLFQDLPWLFMFLQYWKDSLAHNARLIWSAKMTHQVRESDSKGHKKLRIRSQKVTLRVTKIDSLGHKKYSWGRMKEGVKDR